MKPAFDTLSIRPSVRRHWMAAAIMVSACLASCHKEEEAVKSPAPAPTTAQQEPAPAAVPEGPKSAVPAPSAPAPAVAPPAAAEPEVSDKELSQKVAAFKAFHPFGSASELLKMPQFATQLAKTLDDIAKDPALMERVKKETSMPSANEASALSLDLKVSNYTTLYSDRLLAAVLSGQPHRLVDLVLSQPGSSEFIFSNRVHN